MSWTTLCQFEELPPGRGHYVEIGGFQLAVFLDDNRVTVMDNLCPHAGGSLAEGDIEDGCAVCPWHGWAFKLEDGSLRGSPLVTVHTYPTRILDHEGKRFVQADLPVY